MNWYYFVIVAIGGALGACSRYAITLTEVISHEWLSWQTITVNVLGSLVAGFLLTIFAHRGAPSAAVRLLIFTGFLGAFTTFSAFSAENLGFYQQHQWLKLTANIFFNNIGAFAGVLVGSYLAFLLIRG